MKICVLTGGSQGIGSDIAMSFLAHNYKVIVLDILESSHENVDYIYTDLSNPEDIEKAFETIKSTYGTAHILINNGAISIFERPIQDISLKDYDAVLNTNLRGAFLCSQAFIRLNKGENYGRIINIASTRWHQNMADWELYGMSKGGLVSLTNTLCVSLTGSPITVNAISPGFIHTGAWEELEENDHLIHPSNRVGRPRDISNLCLFLAQAENDFINGANIIVDGGMTKKMIY